MREAYNECVPLLTAYSSELGQNAALQAAYAHVLKHEGDALDPSQRKVLENALRDFRLAGVDLPPDQKARYREVAQRLAHLATKFSENVLDAGARLHAQRHRRVRSWPDCRQCRRSRRRRCAREPHQSGWLFKLDQPTYMTVMTSAESEQLRRDIYEAWVTRASELGPERRAASTTTPIIAEILPLRHELALLLGFANFADYALATRMAKSSKQVLGLPGRSGAALPPGGAPRVLGSRGIRRPQAQRLGHRLLRRAAAGEPLQGLAGGAAPLLPAAQGAVWPVRADASGCTASAVRERPGVSVWHPSVRYYDLLDHGRRDRRRVLPRSVFARRKAQRRLDGRMRRRQIAALGHGAAGGAAGVQFHRAGGSRAPSLLTHDEVTTLFHEFGHGLHHMLTRVAYPSIAGINGVAWDAVELPSQFMENFVWRAEVLPLISAHVRQRRAAARRHAAAPARHAHLQRGARHAAADRTRELRFRAARELRSAAWARKVAETLGGVRQRVAVVPAAPFNRMPASFAHIFAGGYAAGYYSYKWAEVLAADAFEAFEEAGVFDAATAARFRESILARGGSLDAMDAFVRFRGRQPDVRPLLKQTGIAA